MQPNQTKNQQTTVLTLGSTSQLKILENIACQKIINWAKDGRLIKHPRLPFILYRWKDWGDLIDVEEFIKKSTSTDEGLIDFITGFLNNSTSHSISDYVGKIHWRINIQDLEKFIDLESVKDRIRIIYSSPNFNTLNDLNKLAIKTFIDTIDGKIKDIF
ncbi:MAG: hypothetical protein ABIA75_12355 [Candidatus Neomarinimicrobiota bacterium]